MTGRTGVAAGSFASELVDAGLRHRVVELGGVAAGVPLPSVLVLSQWTPADADDVSVLVWRDDRVLLPIRVDGSTTLIGPLLHRGAPACLGCVESERLATIGGATPRRHPSLRLGGLAGPTTLPLIAALADAALDGTALGDAALGDPAFDGAAGPTGVVWAIRADGSCSTHRPLPRRGGCFVCAPRPDDTAADARFTPASRPLPDPGRLRADNPATGRDRLLAALRDWRLGPVAHVSRREGFPIALAHAEVVGDWAIRDGGYGRAATFADAERVALFEAVERMTGLGPTGHRTVLRASFADLGPERALDPLRLGEHEPEAVRRPGFHLTPYTPETVLTWVYGWSMGTGRALAVPEQVAYWGRPTSAASPQADSDSPQIVRESSNGCGLGNSLEEAALYGLLEVAERDAFLMAWYARTPLTRVALPDEDTMLAHLADRIEAYGYDLGLFDATNDFGVPAVVSLVTARDPGSPAPQVFVAAGAHPDPREAIRSAVVEVAVNLMISVDLARNQPDLYDRDRLRAMVADPYLVRTPDDHVALYCLPDVRHRLAFLTGGDPREESWRDRWPGRPEPVADLGAHLAAFADHVVRAGMDVIVVDQSDPYTRDRLGLHAAKVIVPGAVPLVFGHAYRRTRGLPRLLDVPVRLGRLPVRGDYAGLALDPHPFP